MKTFIRFTLVSVLSVVFISSCNDKKEKTLAIGYIPIAECAQLYVAQEMGYFKKHGVNIELKPMAGGANILSGLASNSVDVGFSNVVSLVLHVSNGNEYVSVFGGTYESKFHRNHALLVMRDNLKDDIKSTLQGSTISVNTFRNIEELMVKRYLASVGLDKGDYEIVERPFPRMLSALEANEVTVASIVEPFITIAATGDSLGRFVYLDNHYLSNSDYSLVATYVSSKSALSSKSEELKGFIAAMNEATDYINSNELETRKIIGNHTKIPKDLLPKIGLSEFRKDFDDSDLEKIISWMVSEGFVESEKTLSVERYSQN